MRDNEPQHTDEGHNATTALSSTSNSSDVSSCYGAPLTKKIITTGQNQAGEVLSVRDIAIADTTYNDFKRIILHKTNRDNVPFSHIFHNVGNFILSRLPYTSSHKEERHYFVIQQLSRMLKKYRSFYTSYINAGKSYDDAHDKAYNDVKNLIYHEKLQGVLYISGFQSLLGKICYHSNQIHVDSDIEFVPVVEDDSTNSSSNVDVPVHIDHTSKQSGPRFFRKAIYVTPKQDLNFAALHEKELTDGLNENDY